MTSLIGEKYHINLLFFIWILMFFMSSVAEDDFINDLIEELMFVEVTSVSKKAQKLSDAPAAIYVLTAEDIRRSGATSVPGALRMVPGLSVANIDGNKWAISARGFNHLYANKLLVLVDGRSVYSPLFSGVHWEAEDFILEDIERIEVIRGPGANLLGRWSKQQEDGSGSMLQLYFDNVERQERIINEMFT